MTLTVDIGNTNVTCGLFKAGLLIWHARFQTDRLKTSDEYYALLSSLSINAWNVQDVKTVVIASVVPDLTRMWQHLSRKFFRLESMIINGYSKLGLTFAVNDPGFIGADLIANALAAWKKYKTTCLIVDLGTATTLQLVSANGKFQGAIIAPGIITGSRELYEKAALLSEIELVPPQSLLGTNTRDAMLSGIVKGHALMIDGFVKELQKTHQGLMPLKIIATGGIADLISPQSDTIQIIDRTLTLEGLYLAAQILIHKQRTKHSG